MFENIPPVPHIEDVFERGMSKGKRKSTQPRNQVMIAAKHIEAQCRHVVRAFPSMESLDEFTEQMLRLQFSIDDIKQSLGTVSYVGKTAIRTARATPKIGSFVGRMSGVVEKAQPAFRMLADLRREFRKLPSLLDTMRVALVGYPNTGKTSLLADITGANPDIQSYSFTTKYVNAGTLESPYGMIQLLDTPGVLVRDKKNDIERRAFITSRYAAHETVVVAQDLFEERDHDKVVEAFTYRRTNPIVYRGDTATLKKELIRRLKLFQL